jgi:predicted Zn-dependent protease
MTYIIKFYVSGHCDALTFATREAAQAWLLAYVTDMTDEAFEADLTIELRCTSKARTCEQFPQARQNILTRESAD